VTKSASKHRIGRKLAAGLATLALLSGLFIGVADAQSRNVIDGTNANDVIDGTDAADLIRARGGRLDIVNAGGGNDRVIGGSGFDFMRGGAGNDVFVYRQNSGVDVIRDFGDGNDRLVISRDDVDSLDDLLSFGMERTGQIIFDFGGGDRLIVQGANITLNDSNVRIR